jgi:hypothetical protein
VNVIPPSPILTPSIAAVHREHRARLEGLYRGIQPDRLVALHGAWYGRSHGIGGTNVMDMLDEPEAWLAEVLAEMASDQDRLADPHTFRPAVIEVDPLGVHFVDALFGAETRFHSGQCWSAELPYDMDQLECPVLTALPLFQKTLRLCRMAVDAARAYAGEGVIYVATPVLACAINIGINLFGERLLVDLHARPEAAQAALAKLNHTILEAAGRIHSVIPEDIRRNSVAENRLAPAGVGQFDGCATQLVSRRDYARFFAPLDEALMRLSPGGALMHICGAHTQHIATWRAMPGLRAVQLNDRAADDLEAYFHGLREDTVFYVTPNEAMPLEKIMARTGGERLVIQGEVLHEVNLPRLT